MLPRCVQVTPYRMGNDPEPTLNRSGRGDLVVDVGLRRVTHAGADVHLTPNQSALLVTLVRAEGRVVTQSELLETDPARPRHLLTQAGVGYRFQP